ncbi:hypothetical protein K1719_043475 [Acacia pycnantha]|nr:hypothetical protein K1719_043475 [Acacia pycnantha]
MWDDDKSMNMILELLCDAFEHAKIPSSFYEAKKTITKLGLDYRRYMLVQTIVCCIGAWKMKTDKVARFVLYLDGSHLLKKVEWAYKEIPLQEKLQQALQHLPSKHKMYNPGENLENDIQRVESHHVKWKAKKMKFLINPNNKMKDHIPSNPRGQCNKYWVVDVKGFFEERLRIRDVLVLPPHKQVVVTWSEENHCW